MSDLWKISADNFNKDTESIMRSGNVFQIANGYMGYRGTLDEFGADQLVGITLAGIYDKLGDAWREPVNAPNGGYTKLVVDGEEADALKTDIISHTQHLYLQNALFERITEFKLKHNTLRIHSKRFLSSATPNLLVIQYFFQTHNDARIRIHTGIDYNIWDLNGPHLTDIQAAAEGDLLTVTAHTQELGNELAVAELSCCKEGQEKHLIENSKNLRIIDVRAKAGVVYHLYRYIAVVKEGDPDVKNVRKAAREIVRDAEKAGYESCLQDHSLKWKEKWERSDVVIEGDDEAQLALRYSIFQLLMAAPVIGSGNSIPARAFSGQVYKGAIFWDTEMFMFPFFLYTHPEIAAELLRYRINTLDGARRKARTEGVGYRGAFYAWESQDTGDEACTYFNVGDPLTKRELRTHFRDKQIHISGDVAVAMWEYFRITGDDSLLRNGGAEVILECARFYYSYAYFKADKDRFEMLDVIGPDEYHERINNNAFTNKVVKATLDAAFHALAYMGKTCPQEREKLIEKLNIRDEMPLWEDFRNKLYIPHPDEKSGIIEQFDTYFRLEDASVEDVKKRKLHPDEYLGAGQGAAVHTRVIKQADVIMMLNLFRDQYPREVKKANWEYYEPRTEHGSSLSACAYAMVAADIGKTDWAYEYFLKTAKLDLEAKYKVYVGTIFMGGSHPAANGGAWMASVFGFCGLRADTEKVTISPGLYKKWKAVHFKLLYKNDIFSLIVTGSSVSVTASSDNNSEHLFCIGGTDHACRPGSVLQVSYK